MHNNTDAHLSDVDANPIFALTRPDDKLLWLYVIYSLFANIFFLFALIPLFFRFKTLRYRFDAEGVSVAHGILWRRETYLTYARIQDIHVSRNIFERWLGLGKVEIQTASGGTSAEESVEGVKEYNEIRNFLYARMRGHKLTTGGDAASPETGPVDAVLVNIRDELRAIRELIEAKHHV